MHPTFFIAREANQALETKKKLSDFGYRSNILPTVILKYNKEIFPTKENFNSYDGLIFTSIHGVNSLASMDLNIKGFTGMVFAVGQNTAEALKSLGFKNVIFPKEENIYNLLPLIKAANCNNFLYLAGKDRKDFLENNLMEYDLTVIDVYSINPIDFISEFQLRPLKQSKEPHILCFSNRIFEITNNLLEETNINTDDIIWHIVTSNTEKLVKNNYKFYDSPRKMYEALEKNSKPST